MNEPEKRIDQPQNVDMKETKIVKEQESLNTTTQIKSGIYKIVNKVNGKYYVGSAINLKKRKRCHFQELEKQIHHNNHLQHAWNKYGQNAFEFIVVEYVENSDNLLITEQKYLDIIKEDCNRGIDSHYNIAYNSTAPNLGKTLTLKQREHLRSLCKNRRFSEETIQRMKKSAKGRKLSIDTKKKLSTIGSTRKHTNDSKLKISLSKIGNKHCIGRRLEKSSYEKRSESLKKYYKSNPDLYEKQKNKCIQMNRSKMDWSIYNFINIKTKESFKGNIYDFESKFNLKRDFIKSLISKKHIGKNGWKCEL